MAFMEGIPAPFQAFAKSRVRALEISKQDFLTKLPRDFIKTLESTSAKKHIWLLCRMKGISKTSHKIYSKNSK